MRSRSSPCSCRTGQGSGRAIASGELGGGEANSLRVKLESAAASHDRFQDKTAAKQRKAFANEVNTMQKSGD